MIVLLFSFIFLHLLLDLSSLYWSRLITGLSFINPISVSSLIILPLNTLVNVTPLFLGTYPDLDIYVFTVAMSFFYLLIHLASLLLGDRISFFSRLPSVVPAFGCLNRKHLKYISIASFALFIIFMLIISLRTGGVLDWFTNIRTSYIEKRDGNGLFYALAQSSLSASYFAFGFTITSYTFLFFSFFPFVLCAFILGSKGLILGYFSVFLFFSWRLGGHKLMLRSLALLSPPILFLMVFNLYLSYVSADATLSTLGLFKYFDHCTTSQIYYRDFFDGKVDLFDGKILSTSLYSSLPRILFPDKPYIYGIIHINEIYFPNLASTGNTPAFGCGVFQFADFGFPGFILLSFFNTNWFILPFLRRFFADVIKYNSFGIIDMKSFFIGLILIDKSFSAYFSSFSILFLLFFFLVVFRFSKVKFSHL